MSGIFLVSESFPIYWAIIGFGWWHIALTHFNRTKKEVRRPRPGYPSDYVPDRPTTNLTLSWQKWMDFDMMMIDDHSNFCFDESYQRLISV